MKIEYTIKGITLDAHDLCEIHRYYEIACTAEYLLENYPQIKDEKHAMDIGYEVRRIMNKYGYSEDEAIDEVIKQL